MNPSTITVLGAGYVGLTTAALLSHAGYTVYVVEPNLQRLDTIRQGRSFFFEEGLDAVIAKGLEAGTLIPTDSYEESIPQSAYVFSCVGTPDNPDGSSNLDYVFDAAKQAMTLIRPGTIYVQKSTVPVGTGEKIETLFKEHGHSIAYVSNPEFLREGTALYDTICFDRVVVGSNDAQASRSILAIYQQLEAKREIIARIANLTVESRRGEYIATSLASAELIKVTANAFLALKISFANSIAKLADAVDADINEVMDAVGTDTRIGRSFLQAGRGYGGGCFPKDVSGLIASSADNGIELTLMEAAQTVNKSMPHYVIDKLHASLGSFEGTSITVLGLSFKAETSDVRKSPSIAIANLLADAGVAVHAYDPQANAEAAEQLRNTVTLHESIESSIQTADAIIVGTNWKQFLALDPSWLSAHMSGQIICDAVNALNKAQIEAAGLTYIGVGR